MQLTNINIRVTQCYLEMARSVLTKIDYPENKSLDQILAENGSVPYYNMIFAIYSMTIIFSYLAIEAYANYQLHKIWEVCRKTQKTFEEIEKKEPKLSRFCQKYAKYDQFENLKKSNLKNLGERIKTICEIHSFKKIHNINPKLWQDFKDLHEKARHFLIHPLPDPAKFNDMINTKLQNINLGKYVQIAQEIIKHFYKEARLDLPEWIERNKLFAISGFEYLHNV
jgi:hypothetical protein